jgi:adenylyltransferase and sulfurtransferase
MFFDSDLLRVEAERYPRQVVVPGIDIEGQRRLRRTRVLIVGCGGLGSPALMYLASCGIGTIGLADSDRVELHNLQRQVVFSENDIGGLKVEAAAGFARRLNSSITINIHSEMIEAENIDGIIVSYDIVLDCCDNITTRYLLADRCKRHERDLVCGSALKWEGQLYKMTKKGPCYMCLFPNIRSRTQTCDSSGIIGPICGIIGTLQALEAIKIVLGDIDPKMVIYNGFTGKFTDVKLRSSKRSCQACNPVPGRLLEMAGSACGAEEQEAEETVPTLRWERVMGGFDGYFFVDVRPSVVQYRMFRIHGSEHIPLSLLGDEIPLLKAAGKPVAVVCKRGITSRKGTLLLRSHGIEAYSMEGGIDEFKRKVEESGPREER